MGVKVTNNAYGTLSAGIASGDTTITLDGGQGARFPTLGAGDYFYATLVDTANNIEVVKVTARSSDSMTVVRGQDNTTAKAYAIGDRCELRPTAALFNDIALGAELVNDTTPQLGGNLDLNGNDITGTGSISASTITTTGGGGGTAIEVQSGGDLVLKNAGNTGFATLYCDANSEVKTLGTINSGGFLINNNRVRAQKQKVEAAVGNTVMNVVSWTALVSVSITVSAGSSCLVMFNGEQNGEGGDAWQWVALFRDNTQLGTTVIEVTRQSWNSNFHNHYWDDDLSAGTYTYSLKVYNGSNYCRWGEHSGPRIQVVEFAR